LNFLIALATAGVFAAAAYLHDVFGVAAVLAAIIVVARHATVAARVLALPVLISHELCPFLVKEGTNFPGVVGLPSMLGFTRRASQARTTLRPSLKNLWGGSDDNRPAPVPHAHDERVVELNRMLFAIYADD
jgi:hypothetical protein